MNIGNIQSNYGSFGRNSYEAKVESLDNLVSNKMSSMSASASSTTTDSVEKIARQKRYSEFSAKVFDGTPKTKKDILELLKMHFEDGTHFTSIKEKNAAIASLIKKLDANEIDPESPAINDPNISSTLWSVLEFLTVAGPIIQKAAEPPKNPLDENAEMFEWLSEEN